MKKYGLIGSQINYSLSPKLHELIKVTLKLNFSYQILDIKETQLKDYINKLKDKTYNGYNVTIPYKETIIKYLDQLTPAAKHIGAVNTIYYKDGKVIGDNTDYIGFDYLLVKSEVLNDTLKTVYILGSGGAAKACYYALLKRNITPVIVSLNKVEKHFPNYISYEEFYKTKEIDLLINATPVGNINLPGSPIKKTNQIIKTVIDLTYNPLQTTLMSYAQKSLNGLDMLIVQALESQQRWHNFKLKINSQIIDKIKGGLLDEFVR